MDAAIPMNWGIICSIPDHRQMQEFIEFGKWMVQCMEESAATLNMGHRFAQAPIFALHAQPGIREAAEQCYTHIGMAYPEVTYVIHVLPSKDSIEHQVYKEMTLKGALIGQGILAENALNRFASYEIDKVFANMNQWIGRRLAQIVARRTEEELAKEIKEAIQAKSPPPTQSQNQQNQFFHQTNFHHPPRKDQYRMCVSTGPGGGRLQTGPGGPSTGGGTDMNLVQQQVKPPKGVWTSGTDYEFPVSMALHRDDTYLIDRTVPHQLQNYRPPSAGSNYNNYAGRLPQQQPLRQLLPQQQQQVSEGKEREKECIVSGYPSGFNKFQIASLFPDFRPLNVQYIASGESIVQFSNKFQAVQVIGKYNGLCFRNEGFTLQVKTAAQEDPTKQVDAVKAKLARLQLMMTTGKALGKDIRQVLDEQKGKQQQQ